MLNWPAIIEKYEGDKANDMPWVGYYEAKNEWGWKITTNEGENILHYTGIQVSFGVFSYVAFTIDISNKVGKFHLNGVMKEGFDLPISGTRMSSNPDGGSISIGEIAQWDDLDWNN